MTGTTGTPKLEGDRAVARAATAAARLWEQSGPAAITFGAVAEAAGLAKSLVSHHFSTREQLVRDAARLLVAACRTISHLFPPDWTGFQLSFARPWRFPPTSSNIS
ncbi:MAG: helix-turn-helix domain-containing protein [Rhizomicrobium sp.]